MAEERLKAGDSEERTSENYIPKGAVISYIFLTGICRGSGLEQ